MKKLTIILLMLTALTAALTAEDVTIRQIDTARLFTGSKIDCYISVLDDQGYTVEDITPEDIEAVQITTDGENLLDVLAIERNEDSDEGVTFFLLLDNSGSMYLPIGGGEEGTRMDHAQRGVRSFLRALDNPRDKVGMALFNTLYSPLSPPIEQARQLESALDSIAAPSDDEAYTEIYYALDRAIDEVSRFNGRKAIIILSDGENRSYFPETGNPHPDLGELQILPPDVSLRLRREEISVYAIHFSPEKEYALEQVALDSGGIVFDARDEEQLTGVYAAIRASIDTEYKVTLKIPFTFDEEPELQITIDNSRDIKTFAAPQIFGKPGALPWWILLIMLLSAFGLWLLLWALKLEKPAKQAELSQLPAGSGKTIQKTIALASGKTVIGGAPKADVTVVGNPALRDSHATIIQDEEGNYTLISDNEVMVNNRPVKNRKLTPGDVINLEGTTIVFDAPDEKK